MRFELRGLSERAAARRFGIDARTVNKMMKFSVPTTRCRRASVTAMSLSAVTCMR